MTVKGIIPFSITRLIELVLVVAVIGLILFLTIPEVSAWIKKNVLGPLSGEGIPTGVEEAKILEAAIKCSYYRCLDGCGKDKVKNIQVGTKNCDEVYCQPFQKDGRVCGSEAEANPVKVTIANNEVIIREKLKADDLGRCISASDSCTTQFAIKGWVNIQKDAVVEKQYESIDCQYIRATVPGFDRVVVGAGAYEVWTSGGAGILGGFATVVCPT